MDDLAIGPDGAMVQFRALSAEDDLDSSVGLFVECFFHDKYYDGMYPDEGSMRDDFRRYFAWMLENGCGIGAFHDGELVGETVSFPMRKLDEQMFIDFFGEEGCLHDEMSRHMDSVFLFDICVSERFRGNGVASRLFDMALTDGQSYIGDTTGDISREMCLRRGFKVEKMQDGNDWWHKVTKECVK